MTRKDYELIAKRISDQIELTHFSNDNHSARMSLRSLARNLAEDLAKGNQRFDRDRFLAACGAL